jgi:DNA-binding Lrp family transcriptional regulator
MKTPTCDAIDLKILAILQENGRIKFQELAEKVSLSASPCLARVRRLESAGIIKGYSAVVDVSKLRSYIEIYTEISLAQQGNHRQTAFVQYLRGCPQLLELLETSGRSDYLGHFVCASLAEYQVIIDHLLESQILGVAHVTSHIVMKAVIANRGFDMKPISDRGAVRAEE